MRTTDAREADPRVAVPHSDYNAVTQRSLIRSVDGGGGGVGGGGKRTDGETTHLGDDDDAATVATYTTRPPVRLRTRPRPATLESRVKPGGLTRNRIARPDPVRPRPMWAWGRWVGALKDDY